MEFICYSRFADDFLASGIFEGDLGNLMVLTIANILHCPITLFTSINDMPIICIVETMDTTHPLFLTFIQSGSGHYDYALPCNEAKVQAKARIKCNCGRKTDFKGKACLTSRCTCVRSCQPCTSLCRCKTCSNSHGIRPQPSSVRRRMAYDTQRQPLCGQTGDSFTKGESNVHGQLSLFEVLVLKTVILYFILHGID